MTSWRLWQALHHATWDNRIYWKLVTYRQRMEHNIEQRVPAKIRRALAFAVVLPLLLIINIITDVWLICYPAFAIVLIGTVGGFISTIKVSERVAYEREQGRYELLGITPIGFEGVGWIICVQAYHSSRLLNNLRTFAQGAYSFAGGSILFLALVLFISGAWINLQDLILGPPMSLLPVIGLLYVDLVQSIVIGCVSGLIIGTYPLDRISAPALAMASFFGVQIVSYTIILTIWFIILPQVTPIDTPIGLLTHMLTFILCRELCLQLLWVWLATRLDVKNAELHQTVEAQP